MTIKKEKFENNARTILANNIVFFRLKNNWSQEKFAEKIGSTVTYISNIENAKRNMRIDYIGHIADTFNVSLEELFVERDIIDNHRINRK